LPIDADQALGPVVLDPLEKAMAPAKGGVAVHADTLGRRADCARIEHRVQIFEPLSLVPEPRQRRAGQVIEGAAACATAKALQVVGLAMPVASLAGAIRAAAPRWPDLADEGDHPVEAG
jgi:hypothetical protein